MKKIKDILKDTIGKILCKFGRHTLFFNSSKSIFMFLECKYCDVSCYSWSVKMHEKAHKLRMRFLEEECLKREVLFEKINKPKIERLSGLINPLTGEININVQPADIGDLDRVYFI